MSKALSSAPPGPFGSGVAGGPGPNTNYGNYLGSVIQSPDIDKEGKPQQKSIRDAGMAADVIKTVVMAGRNRSIVNSRILAKYNAERPFEQAKLEAEGLGWKQNFTTKPLPSMIEKIAPRFMAAVDALKYFTNATLPNRYGNATEKSEKFRDLVTKTIRARPGFRTLVEDIAFNNALFGNDIVAWLDEYSWFPKNFQQDEGFAADGTKSDARIAQVLVLKEVFYPHELFDHVKDKEAAKMAGWNVESTFKAINEASPVQIRDRLNVGGTLETWYQNALRELTIGASYMAGASVIVVYSLLAREVTGKVSHYRLAGPGLTEIFSRDDRFPSMEDCLSFFTFQKGNGTLHGSKGVGRDIYEMAGMIDRTRNDAVDRMVLSGKTIIQGDIKRIHTFKMSVVGAVCIMPNGWQIVSNKIEGNTDEFLKMDAYFNKIVDQLVGAISPPQVEGEAFRSPQAWQLMAQREEEGRDIRITRFLEQITSVFQTMQRRLVDSDTVDEDAKELQRQLKEFMTPEEIKIIAEAPVSGTVRDLTPLQRQLLVSIAAEKKGNPLYNQRQLEVEDLTARAGADFVQRVLLPDNDPTVSAEQNREQNFEIVLLSAGQPVPVSPRDNHMIHMQVLMPTMQQAAQHINDGSLPTPVLDAMFQHLQEHFTRAQEQGAPKDQLKPIQDLLNKLGPAIAQLHQLDQQAAVVGQMSQAHDQGLNVPAPGGPMPLPQPPTAPQ
jgi:hypothetical protein